jgi:uncharacterized membrane-anchored protein
MKNQVRLLVLATFVLSTPSAHAAKHAKPPAPPAAAEEATPAPAEESDEANFFKSMSWTMPGEKATIGDLAELAVPEGTRFTGPDGTRKLLEAFHNPTDGSELGLLTTDELDWYIIFDFADIGYVKDADKEKLDADEMLESLRAGNRASNEERQKRGWPTITLTGWHTPPFYNKETNNLEWCIKGASQGHDIVNYNTRILGRGGVMSANLLVAPDKLDATLPSIKAILQGFSYREGQKYSEWKSGDKIAKYGLSALVVGGAVGVAAKLGLLGKLAASLGKLWKVIILGLLGALAALKQLLFGKKQTPPPAAPRDQAPTPPTTPPDAGAPPSDPQG